MSERKFTAGPWVFQQGYLWERGSKIMPERYIKTTDSPWIANAHDTDPEAIANMHLIAAAPDLYAELTNLVMRFEAACRYAGNDDEYIALATGKARAVLGKARGDEP